MSNQGTYGFSRPKIVYPELKGFTKGENTTTIPVPANAEPGDLLVLAIGTRNGETTPGNSFYEAARNDASSQEMNQMYVKIAGNEPVSYTVSYTGYMSYVLACFKVSGSIAVLRSGFVLGANEYAPALAGVDGGLFLGMACCAATTNYVSGFVGMTTIARQQNGNAGCMLAYLITYDERSYGPYAAIGTSAFDGYTSVLLGNTEALE